MSPRLRAATVALAALFVVPGASAQARVMKCIDDHGRVTYAELGCGAEAAVRQSAKLTDNSFDGGRYSREPDRRAAAERSAPRQRSYVEESTSGEDVSKRRRELIMAADSHIGSEEERRAAQDELGRLDRGVSQRLTDEKRRRRDDLMRETTGTIAQPRRARGTKELEHLQDKYESSRSRQSTWLRGTPNVSTSGDSEKVKLTMPMHVLS